MPSPNQPPSPNPANFKPPNDTAPIAQVTTLSSPGGGSFVVNGQKFVPRGANYERLANTIMMGLIELLAPCPTSIPVLAQALTVTMPSVLPRPYPLMAHDGCNVVRVEMNKAEIGNPSGPGLSPADLANLASFINIARYYSIRVMIYISPLPHTTYHQECVLGGVKNSRNLFDIEPSYLAGRETACDPPHHWFKRGQRKYE